MHDEILSKAQNELLPYLKNFKRTFYMVGGTAIALHIGHRRSIDFDLFSPSRLAKKRIKSKLRQIPFNQVKLFEDSDQIHLLVNDVKMTFFNYPYPILHPQSVNSYITIPSLLTLASMKAFPLGRRAKWKDYVDLYFILKNYFTIQDISKESKIIFRNDFSEKLFREQLAFHKDIDFSEPIEWVFPEVSEKEIKEFLIDKATDINLKI